MQGIPTKFLLQIRREMQVRARQRTADVAIAEHEIQIEVLQAVPPAQLLQLRVAVSVHTRTEGSRRHPAEQFLSEEALEGRGGTRSRKGGLGAELGKPGQDSQYGQSKEKAGGF